MPRSKTSKFPLTMKILDYVLEAEVESFEEAVGETGEFLEKHVWYVAMLAKLELTGQVKYDGKIAKNKKKLDQLIRETFGLEEEEEE